MMGGKENGCACLFACKWPFLEDVRQIEFPSLQSSNTESVQTAQRSKLTDAAESIVQALDLDNSLDYRSQFNPAIQKFYGTVNKIVTEGAWDRMAEHEGSGGVLKRSRSLWESQAVTAALRSFHGCISSFPGAQCHEVVTVKEEEKTAQDSIKAELLSESNAKMSRNDGSVLHAHPRIRSTTISTNNPLNDFVDVWESDDFDAHDKAVKLMLKVVEELVDSSPGDRHYGKALECLRKLREWCDMGRADEQTLFNQGLKHLHDRYMPMTDRSFGVLLLQQADCSFLPVKGGGSQAPAEAEAEICGNDDDQMPEAD